MSGSTSNRNNASSWDNLPLILKQQVMSSLVADTYDIVTEKFSADCSGLGSLALSNRANLAICQSYRGLSPQSQAPLKPTRFVFDFERHSKSDVLAGIHRLKQTVDIENVIQDILIILSKDGSVPHSHNPFLGRVVDDCIIGAKYLRNIEIRFSGLKKNAESWTVFPILCGAFARIIGGCVYFGRVPQIRAKCEAFDTVWGVGEWTKVLHHRACIFYPCGNEDELFLELVEMNAAQN